MFCRGLRLLQAINDGINYMIGIYGGACQERRRASNANAYAYLVA